MTEVNLKNYDFESYLLDNVKLFDEVLNELGEQPLFENENFSVCPAFQVSSNYLVIESNPKRANTLPISIWFEVDNLRIDMDEIPETFVWGKKHIEQDRNAVIKFIENLFTGYISIDYRGSSARFVQMFDADGFFVNSFSRNVLLHMFGCYLLRQRDYRKLFLPLFSRLK